ncbi:MULTISPECIES: hypothetical protein [Fibrobacter]|uniref:Uncharacterized protein n=1 Tax=Fibrobacter intestinalis TaxID=28122 RepID=A0A1T4R4I0_9BACT|nr:MULTISPECIES: hypothetical protein [Fibrobacter]PBC69485.1 hypothetical protein BGX14_1907 [Fibrobacter sp. UWS1]PBC74703.1 hypothetical protein BGW94_2374 [Fibrobacter sp. NR9]SKA10775.1 hypothetical protein SAMN02745108_02546 [Fibrobacter intestinalis]
MLQEEVHIICRILSGDSVTSLAIDNAPDEILVEKCRELSRMHQCKSMICRDQEFFGVSHVYNGGSDFGVVEEDCFLVICENGKLLLSEHSDSWNCKANIFLK